MAHNKGRGCPDGIGSRLQSVVRAAPRSGQAAREATVDASRPVRLAMKRTAACTLGSEH